MSLSGPAELDWTINGLRIAGLAWGDPGGKPVLALHGWLDNAASFSVLAPLLHDCYVVALDLTGHGQSDSRSADAAYQIWDDLPEILGVLDALGWTDFNLLGHSRGAIISTLLASVCPERVRRLVLLDAVGPEPIAEQSFVEQLRKHLQEKPRLLARSNRVFARREDAVASREQGGLDRRAAKLLAERNLRACTGGFTWTTDLRLRGASAAKLTAGQNRAVLQALRMPSLLLLAVDGLGKHREVATLARECTPDLTLEWVHGGHHFHMEGGAPQIAQRLALFFVQ